ncbi:extracellular solute-binding protein [Microbacterium sp. LWH11-1.2]|uniref:ABC transporter substrate-binding protein n=1 Tax=Microbacterium sp. LWH11-1.2 TaxID=3135258 RepID=UPI003138B3E7
MKPGIKVLAAISAAAAVVGLVGCTASDNGDGADSGSGEEVTLRWTTYSQERLEFYEKAAAEFNKEFPNIKVVPETLVEGDYYQALPLSFRSRNAPDIFVYTSPSAGEYFELADVLGNEWAQPLDKSVLPDDFASRFPGTSDLAEPTYSRDGEIYTIPRPPSTGALGYGYMYFNKDVLDAAGLADSIPETWDEFTEACEAIAETGAKCLSVPTQGPEEIGRLLTVFMGVNMKGYRPLGPSIAEGDYSQILDPDYVDALEYLRSLYADGHVVPGSYDKVAGRQAVATGDAAFYFDGGWMSSVFPESFEFENFGVALPPGKDGVGAENYEGLIGQGPPMPETFISAQSEHPKEATQFLEWMTRPDGWYAKEFSKNGFDALPWIDPEKVSGLVPESNPAHDLFALSPKVHVLAPQASLKCPDLAQSKALTNVENIRPQWVNGTIVQYLLNGGDWEAIAEPIVAEQNKVLEDTLDAEAKSGLDVSTECFAEPDWDGLTPFEND